MNKSSGNILFLILIAVALFAALSYTVTQSNRSNSSGIAKDKARLIASEIIQYAAQIQNTVSRLQIINHCTVNDLSFYTGKYPYHFTSHATSFTNIVNIKPECNVFDATGGAAPAKTIPSNVTTIKSIIGNASYRFLADGFIPNRAYIEDVGRNYDNGADYGAADIALTLSFLDENLCLALNDLQNINNPNGKPPEITQGGLLSISSRLSVLNPSTSIKLEGVAQLKGKHAGCFYNSGTQATVNGAVYTYYHVLVAQ